MSDEGVLVLATGNPGKIREIQQILSDAGVRLVPVAQVLGYQPEVEESGSTFEENARIKAEAVARLTGLPALADDSGLEVDALDGRPGVWSARYAGPGADNDAKISKLLGELQDVPDEKRTARFRCVVCLVEPVAAAERREVLAQGTCEGRIARAPRGNGGFGYDPIFWLPDVGKTMAELSSEEKNARSHRAAALRALLEKRPRLLG